MAGIPVSKTRLVISPEGKKSRWYKSKFRGFADQLEEYLSNSKGKVSLVELIRYQDGSVSVSAA